MTATTYIFKSLASASTPVAGLPLLVRTVQLHNARTDASLTDSIALALPGGSLGDGWLRDETARLFAQQALRIVDSGDPASLLRSGDVFAAAEACLDPSVHERSLADGSVHGGNCIWSSDPDEVLEFEARMSDADVRDAALLAGRAVLRGMGKPTDGIVSRYINRPISTRISHAMLKFRWFRPGHGTIMTGVTALMMLFCLFSGTQWGLISGAVLFQIASIIDGVDGEVARATLRTTDRGAMLDSMTDAATNLGFLLGLAVNLHMQGIEHALAMGLFAFSCLAAGMALLGGHAVWSGKPVNFDSGKSFLQRRPTWWKQVLIWVFMRDFFAFAAMAKVLFGLAPALLAIFAIASAGWLLFVMMALSQMRQRGVEPITKEPI